MLLAPKGLDHALADASRTVGDNETGGLQGFDLVAGGALAAEMMAPAWPSDGRRAVTPAMKPTIGFWTLNA